MIRQSLKRGPEAARESGPVVVSATKFTYRRLRYMPLVAFHAWRLRRAWRVRPGAVGLITGGEPFNRITYSLSAWTSEDDLRRFLGSPEHVKLVRGFRRRLVGSTSVLWEADAFSPDEAWREGLRRLAEA